MHDKIGASNLFTFNTLAKIKSPILIFGLVFFDAPSKSLEFNKA